MNETLSQEKGSSFNHYIENKINKNKIELNFKILVILIKYVYSVNVDTNNNGEKAKKIID